MKKHGNIGNKNALGNPGGGRPKTQDSFLHIKCKREDKACWVKSALNEKMNLTTWVIKTLNKAVKF